MQKEKERLINELIEYGYLKTKEIIDAFKKVPRENFVEEDYRKHAYVNEPLPIRAGQTISQPLTVAAMTEALQPRKGSKILEIGAGSGYQAAILAETIGPSGIVITLERKSQLVEFARKNIEKSGYKNVKIVHSDGTDGWPKEAPYDRIIVTAAAQEVPKILINQLKHGRLVIPVNDKLFLIEKNKNVKETFLGYYAFVPLLKGEE